MAWCLPKSIEDSLFELLSGRWFTKTRILWSNVSRSLPWVDLEERNNRVLSKSSSSVFIYYYFEDVQITALTWSFLHNSFCNRAFSD